MTPARWVEQLWADHHTYIRRYLLARTGDRALAEDLTSETFLRALLAAGRYTENNPQAWLQRIAQHIHIDLLRSARYRRETSLDEYMDVFADKFDELDVGPDLDPARIVECITDLAERRMQLDTLLGAIETMGSANRRRCLQLDLAEATTSEQCAVLGTTPGALRVLRHRAIAELRARIGVAA